MVVTLLPRCVFVASQLCTLISLNLLFYLFCHFLIYTSEDDTASNLGFSIPYSVIIFCLCLLFPYLCHVYTRPSEIQCLCFPSCLISVAASMSFISEIAYLNNLEHCSVYFDMLAHGFVTCSSLPDLVFHLCYPDYDFKSIYQGSVLRDMEPKLASTFSE